MTKQEIKAVVRDFLEDKVDWTITAESIYDTMGGCAFWTEKKMIRKEMLVRFLSYQVRCLNGSVDEQEFQTCCDIFKCKILMV